jgi:predicted RNA-binding protein YlqC (UPF0109 family)
MEEKELVEYIVKALVDSPDDVNINIVEGERSTILELKVKQEDVGKVIGRQGRVAKSIRTIVNACAAKTGKRIMLEIL